MIESPFRILIKYPSRGRPERFFEGMEAAVNNLSDKEHYHISCTLDSDDPSMNNQQVIDRIMSYKNTSIAWGLSKSKIDAINRDMPDYGSIIVIMSDDQRPNLYGWDDTIRVHLNQAFADFDGMLGYLDVDTKGVLPTMYIASRKFYERFGYVYHDSYLSLWCDNEIVEQAKMLGRYHYVGQVIHFHDHPAYHLNVPRDLMFDAQQAQWPVDEANYNERKKRNFDIHLYK